MRKLEGYTKYPFEGVRVGRSIFAQFILILIDRLVATGLAVYNPIILEIRTAYNLMFGVISQNMQDLSDQMSETGAVKQIRKNWGIVVDKVQTDVRYKFGKNSSEDKKFFPHGISPYKKAPLSDFLIKIELLEKYCTEYVADLGAPLLAEVTAIKTEFITERDSQLQLIGKVKSIIPNYAQKQDNMIKLTYKAMLTILLQNVDNPRVMLTFFDEQLIYPKNFEPYELDLAPQSREVADIKFKSNNTIILAHIMGGDFLYFFATTPNEEVPENPSKLVVDEEVEIKCSSMPADKKYLILLNRNDSEGKVQIAVTK